MRLIYFLLVLLAGGIGGCATVPHVPEGPKIIEETVRSKSADFKRNLKIEIARYLQARIENVYLEHGQRKDKTSTKDYLYIHGTVANQSISLLSGATVKAELFDNAGNLIVSGFDDATPRIMRHRGSGRSKGYFTIRVLYDSQAALCKLTLGRGQQALYFKELE